MACSHRASVGLKPGEMAHYISVKFSYYSRKSQDWECEQCLPNNFCTFPSPHKGMLCNNLNVSCSWPHSHCQCENFSVLKVPSLLYYVGNQGKHTILIVARKMLLLIVNALAGIYLHNGFASLPRLWCHCFLRLLSNHYCCWRIDMSGCSRSADQCTRFCWRFLSRDK